MSAPGFKARVDPQIHLSGATPADCVQVNPVYISLDQGISILICPYYPVLHTRKLVSWEGVISYLFKVEKGVPACLSQCIVR